MELKTANPKGKCNVSKTQQGCQHEYLESTLGLTHPHPPPPWKNRSYTPEPHHLDTKTKLSIFKARKAIYNLCKKRNVLYNLFAIYVSHELCD